MDKKKVTRRVAIGTAVGGLAAAPFIIRALTGRYEVDMPDGPVARTVGGEIDVVYGEKEIRLDIPSMELKTPEDEERFRQIVMQKLKESPVYEETTQAVHEDWKERTTKSVMATLDESEKEVLEEIAERAKREGMGRAEEQALIKQWKDRFQAERSDALKQIENTKAPTS